MMLENGFAQPAPRELLDQRGRELEDKDGEIGHDADAYIEQYGAAVPHHDGMPEAPGQPDLIKIAHHHRAVAEERNQDGGAQDRTIAFHAKQVNRAAEAETGGGKFNAY